MDNNIMLYRKKFIEETMRQNLTMGVGQANALEISTLTSYGFKIAFLSGIEPVEFEGVTFGKYGLKGKFKCENPQEKGMTHKTPELKCSCGFYSFNNLKGALKMLTKYQGAVLILVENYGVIVEHSHGYRAEIQEIKSILLPPTCSQNFCFSEITHLSKGAHYYEGYCAKHALISERAITLSDIPKQLGISLKILTPKEILISR